MNYSARKKNKIVKYIVIHYTGMKNLKLAYKKLSDNHSNVSSHYLISKNGDANTALKELWLYASSLSDKSSVHYKLM